MSRIGPQVPNPLCEGTIGFVPFDPDIIKNIYKGKIHMISFDSYEPEFRRRLEQCYDEIKWLYAELYGNDQQAFEYFVYMLHEYYAKRGESLKELDRKREADPRWYSGNNMLGMQMYVNCFGQTLNGVNKHLNYIKQCGANYLHLMPLLQTTEGKSDGGYAVSDFRKIDPKLGTMEDLSNLSERCHSMGISICLDFVMNHTSEDHEWARRAKAGEKEYQDRYLFFDNWNIPNDLEKTVPQVFPQTAPGNFSWCEEAHKVVMTTFYPYQWDLNYHNPTVFNDMTANMLNLCNHGVDIIRLDATPYIWKTLGTNCRNLPQVHTLVRIMHMACDVVCPGTLLLGEVVMEPSKVVPYFGTVDRPECQMLYNVTTMASTWHTVATGDVRLMKHQLGSVFALPKQYTFLNYLRCHDDIGWGLDYEFLKQFGVVEAEHKKFLNDTLSGKIFGKDGRGELYNDDPRLKDARLCGTTASLCGIEAAEYERTDWKIDRGIRLDLMLHAFLLTQSGIPIIYSGDEIGLLNDYSYHKDPLKWDDSRYIHRGDFDWKAAVNRKKPETREGRIYAGIQKLVKLRKAFDVFVSEADTWVVETYNDHVLGIGRYHKDQKMIALFNFSDSDETAWINESERFYDLMTGEERNASAVPLTSYGFAWLITSFKDPEGKPKKLAAIYKQKEAKAAPKKAAAKTKKVSKKK